MWEGVRCHQSSVSSLQVSNDRTPTLSVSAGLYSVIRTELAGPDGLYDDTMAGPHFYLGQVRVFTGGHPTSQTKCRVTLMATRYIM